jgi:hypothetical protein
MFRKLSILLIVVALSLVMVIPALAAGPPPGTPQGGRVVDIYVTGQGKVYQSIVGPNLPSNGPFQKLEMDGPTGLQTEFGPGDTGYVGGRWWVDKNGNNEMDPGVDAFFSCPLIGPGHDL